VKFVTGDLVVAMIASLVAATPACRQEIEILRRQRVLRSAAASSALARLQSYESQKSELDKRQAPVKANLMGPALRGAFFILFEKSRSDFVDECLHRVLGVSDSPLGFALKLLSGALDLEARIADDFADGLFDRASGFIRCAVDLVNCAIHGVSPKGKKAMH
jgi:hypothetical protein